MDREQFREQITQRYVAGKALDGASADEIAKGIVDPVEQMNYVSGLGTKPTNSAADTGSGLLGGLVLICLIALALLSVLFRLLH